MVVSEEELKRLIGYSFDIEKITTLSSDGRNLLIRIPKDIREHLHLKKGNKFRWLVDGENIKIEVIK